jgi:hypothetical protein
MKIPTYVKIKIADFKPKYKDLQFESEEAFQTWLKSKSVAKITFEDEMQDLMSFDISEEGEILNTEMPNLGNIYNGSLLLNDLKLIYVGQNITVWMPEFNEATTIKYKVESVIKN